MRALVDRSDAHGFVRVPGSKSYTIRAATCAAMADGESVIQGALESDDSAAAFECLGGLGAQVHESADVVYVRGGHLRTPEAPLWCSESGATFRFLAALAATIPGVTVLRCSPLLARRPMAPLVDAIRQLHVACEFDAIGGMMVIHGRRQSSGRVKLRGDVSSQFLSAMLMSGPRYEDGLRVDLASPLVSQRYVDMTRECMREFGVEVDTSTGGSYLVSGGFAPTSYAVEGDWSGAAAALALGALAGDVRVAELSRTSLQADVAMLELLDRMGASVEDEEGVVRVRRVPLHACTFDLSDAIDLLPVACALGAAADGITRLTGVARARDKESDRVASMADGLRCLGVRVDVEEDEMRVSGGTAWGGVVSSAGDHRVAMAFGILGAVTGNLAVDGAECVSKTYPGFWDMLRSLGVKVALYE